MMLSTHELDRADIRHLFCTDPRVAEEIDAVNRSLKRLDETVPTWTYLDPNVALDGKEVAA